MADPTPPPAAAPGAFSLSIRTLTDALALLIPALITISQYLKAERSYEVIFLGLALTVSYFYLRGQTIQMTALKAELASERAENRALSKEMERRDDKCQADMQVIREKNDSEIAAMDVRYRRMIGTVETSLINAFSDLTVFSDRRRIGHFSRDPLDNMLVYERAPVLLPPTVTEDRRGTGNTIIPGITTPGAP